MIVLFPSGRQKASRGRLEGAATPKFVTSTAESVDPDELRSRARRQASHPYGTSEGLPPQQRQRIRALSREDLDRHESRGSDIEWRLRQIRAEVARDPSIVSAAAAFLSPMSGEHLIGP